MAVCELAAVYGGDLAPRALLVGPLRADWLPRALVNADEPLPLLFQGSARLFLPLGADPLFGSVKGGKVLPTAIDIQPRDGRLTRRVVATALSVLISPYAKWQPFGFVVRTLLVDPVTRRLTVDAVRNPAPGVPPPLHPSCMLAAARATRQGVVALQTRQGAVGTCSQSAAAEEHQRQLSLVEEYDALFRALPPVK